MKDSLSEKYKKKEDDYRAAATIASLLGSGDGTQVVPVGRRGVVPDPKLGALLQELEERQRRQRTEELFGVTSPVELPPPTLSKQKEQSDEENEEEEQSEEEEEQSGEENEEEEQSEEEEEQSEEENEEEEQSEVEDEGGGLGGGDGGGGGGEGISGLAALNFLKSFMKTWQTYLLTKTATRLAPTLPIIVGTALLTHGNTKKNISSTKDTKTPSSADYMQIIERLLALGLITGGTAAVLHNMNDMNNQKLPQSGIPQSGMQQHALSQAIRERAGQGQKAAKFVYKDLRRKLTQA